MNQTQAFHTILLDWYDNNKRDLPWRKSISPYHIWLSEIMLQQTRVEAVTGYYERFLQTFPDIASLAKGKEDVYMKLWEGLGYYSRVKNLHRGAVQVVDQYGGKLPERYLDLLHIAGIGPYTAAAIASMAFGQKIPSIDGNLLRVFARLSVYAKNIKEKEAKDAAFQYFLERMPADRPGDFNQALMDLGATVCLANGVPLCAKCPLRDNCLAFEEGNMLDYPNMPKKKKRAIEKLTVFFLHDRQRAALRKRPDNGLLAGLYEFPNVSQKLTIKEAKQHIEDLGIVVKNIRKLSPSKHVFTHKEWHMQAYDMEVDFTNNKPGYLLCNMRVILENYSIPSAFRAYKEYMQTFIKKNNI